MMKKFLEDIDPLQALGYILILLWLSLVVFTLSSCEVTKAKKTVKDEKVELSKSDSGQVTKTASTEKAGEQYWKETIVYQPAARDCTINRNYNTYPAVIYREGGTKTLEKTNTVVDSSWKNAFDSLQQKIQTADLQKKTKVLSIWHIIAIAAGIGLVSGGIIPGISKFKIIRR